MQWDKLQIGDACIYKNGIYFFDNWSQSIVYLDFTTNTLELKKIYYGTYFMASKILICNNNLFIFSGNSPRVLNYYILTEEYEEILGENKKNYICTLICIGMKVWYIPQDLNENIMVFDIKEYLFYADIDYKSIFKGYEKYTCNYPTKSGTIIWHSLTGTNKIIGYDVLCQKVYEKSSPVNHRLSTVYVQDNIMYFSQVDSGDMIIVEGSKTLTVKADSEQKDAYSYVYKFEDKLWFLPRYGNEILIYDTKNRKAKRVCYSNKIIDNNSPSAAIGCVFFQGKMIVLPWKVGPLYVIDENSEIVKKLDLKLRPEDYCKIMYQKKAIIKETNEVGIRSYINAILQDDNTLQEQECYDEKDIVGNAIWKYVR